MSLAEGEQRDARVIAKDNGSSLWAYEKQITRKQREPSHSDKDMDNTRQEERSRPGRRYRIFISASIVIVALLFVLLYFKSTLLDRGGRLRREK